MESEVYLKVMTAIAREASVIALNNIHQSEPTLKADQSVLTITDKAISNLCRDQLAPFLKDPDHILIDEEDPNQKNYFNESSLNTKYIWSIDPIDGTRLYANRMPTYGISIGLLRDRKPWLGVVAFPYLNEFFYADGKRAYWTQGNNAPVPIVPIDQTIDSHSIFLCTDNFFNKFKWDYRDAHVMIQACAVVNLCWPSIGRGCGCFLKSNLWDFAGSWPIVQAAGLGLRNFETGELLNEIRMDIFSSKYPWALKEYYLISSERNFPVIKSRISRVA
jgi:fructose-1,6-bisphosphatase/inositol monophosphatase family enzyme